MGSAPTYCNAMIACDAFTFLTPGAVGAPGSLETDSATPAWTASAEPSNSKIGTGTPGTYVLNAAIMTGNRATPATSLPPNISTDAEFEAGYEGGWHSIRFLEDLGAVTLHFRGSFICMWEAADPGLNRTGKVQNTNYYSPPGRDWGFDPRFEDLNNMPPATPFLTTSPQLSWSEKN